MIDDSDIYAFKQVIFAGFFALTRCEKTMFQKLLLMDNTLLMFQDSKGMKEKLVGLGVRPVEEKWEADKAEVHFYSSPDTHGQSGSSETSKSQNHSPSAIRGRNWKCSLV